MRPSEESNSLQRRLVMGLYCAAMAITSVAVTAADVSGGRPNESQRASKSEFVSTRVAYGTNGDTDSPFRHVSGTPYVPQSPNVASPSGSTYSVHHRVGADPDGEGSEPTECFLIFNPLGLCTGSGDPCAASETCSGFPEATCIFGDDIVTFDGGAENIRTDLFSTTPTVTEFTSVNDEGVFLLTIDTSSPSLTDLFPSGLTDLDGNPLTDACFTIGIDDPLSWPDLDTVIAATLERFSDGVPLGSPMLITNLFTSPWDGFLNVVIPDVAGAGTNHVRVVIQLEKTADAPANDDCMDAITLEDGSTAYTNVGSTTDGPDEPLDCGHSGDTDVRSDIWYHYTASCYGNATIHLCDSTFDTRLAVYDGCGVCPPPQRPIACNDDFGFCGAFGNRSKVTIPVIEDDCYTIRVGGFFGDQGAGFVNVECTPGVCCIAGQCQDGLNEPLCTRQAGKWTSGKTCAEFICPGAIPPNDECVDCITLTTDQPHIGTTAGATGNETSSCTGGDTADVWHCWTADCTGRARFSLCDSDFDTTIAVFDNCGGNEIACNDDGCPEGSLASSVIVSVTAETTYYVRVAGFNGDTGVYSLNVEPCTAEPVACCLTVPSCLPMDSESCVAFGGEPRGEGSTCVGDLDGNGIDEACEPCPSVTIGESVPAIGTVDARQPHRLNDPTPRQGIGAPGNEHVAREPIIVQLTPPVTGASECFSFCETEPDPASGANDIQSVTDLGGGRYEILLDRPITTYAMSFIEYMTDGSRVSLTSHPGNVDGNGVVDRDDLIEFIGCCLQDFCLVERSEFICDVDRSGTIAAPDLLRVIDVLNGAATFDVWNGTIIPNGAACP